MTEREKHLVIVCAVLGALILIGSVIGAVEYVRAVRLLAAAQANGEAQDKIIKSRDVVIADAEKRMRDRDDAWDGQQKELAEVRDKIKTLADATRAIKQAVPGAVVAPITREQLPPDVQKQLPDAPSYAVVPQETFAQLARKTVDLEIAEAHVAKLTADNADLTAQLKATTEKWQAAEDKAQKWETAAHGGTFMHRAFVASKYVAVGVAIGYATAHAR